MAAPVQTSAGTRPPPRLRRAYYDCRFGQLHLHNAIPGGGGFDELTAAICLPATGETGGVFAPLLQTLGFDRSVYSLDLPGSGESDPAPGVPPADAAVQAVEDFTSTMRIRQFDLLARGDACVPARQLARQLGGAVRRLVLLGEVTPGIPLEQKLLSLPLSDADSPGFASRVGDFLAAGM